MLKVSEKNCVAASFLTTKGRILANAFIYDLPKDSVDDAASPAADGVIVEVHSSVAQEFARFLSTYKLRSKVKIEQMADVRCSFFPRTDSLSASSVTAVLEHFNTEGSSSATPLLAVQDPRTSPSLGCRVLLTTFISPSGNILTSQ